MLGRVGKHCGSKKIALIRFSAKDIRAVFCDGRVDVWTRMMRPHERFFPPLLIGS